MEKTEVLSGSGLVLGRLNTDTTCLPSTPGPFPPEAAPLLPRTCLTHLLPRSREDRPGVQIPYQSLVRWPSVTPHFRGSEKPFPNTDPAGAPHPLPGPPPGAEGEVTAPSMVTWGRPSSPVDRGGSAPSLGPTPGLGPLGPWGARREAPGVKGIADTQASIGDGQRCAAELSSRRSRFPAGRL